MALSNKPNKQLKLAFSISERCNCVGNAALGLWLILKDKKCSIVPSFRLSIVIIAAYSKQLNKTEQCMLDLAIGISKIAEFTNTVAEKTYNFISKSIRLHFK
jgi:diacylglycerol kinase